MQGLLSGSRVEADLEEGTAVAAWLAGQEAIDCGDDLPKPHTLARVPREPRPASLAKSLDKTPRTFGSAPYFNRRQSEQNGSKV